MAKAAGAKFDFREKRWYAPKGKEPGLAQWKPQDVDPPEAQLRAALKANGLIVSATDELVMDGTWKRAKVEGDKGKEKSGRWRAFSDQEVPAGNITNFKTGSKEKWIAEMPRKIHFKGRGRIAGNNTDPARAKTAPADHVPAQQKLAQAEAEIRAEQDKVARRAFGIWKNCEDWANPDNCGYLANKQAKGYGLKLGQKDAAIVPLRNKEGKIRSLQFINDDGSKTFLKGGEVTGNYHVIDPNKHLGKADTLWVVEGYATGETVHKASKKPVIVAFNKGNLPVVVASLREQYPDTAIHLASDHDHKMDKDHDRGLQAGLHKSLQAAAESGAKTFLPRFTMEEKQAGLTDFKDLELSRGIEVVRNQLSRSLSQTVEVQHRRSLQQQNDIGRKQEGLGR